jgi:uncharacterized protein (DUF2062 family)
MEKKFRKFYRKIKSIIRLKASPYAIAMGAALGLFLNFIPSFGIGFLIAAALARFVKASAIAALIMNLGTGIFIPMLYSLNFLTGRFLLRSEINPEEAPGTIGQPLPVSPETVGETAGEPIIYFFLEKLQLFTVDFFLGSMVNAFAASGLIYLIFWSLLTYRQRRKESLKKSNNSKNNETAIKTAAADDSQIL